ncbi:MAG TPA: hypothetical protein VH593_21425, partial [Ktedonobacteraceae bacterium]
PPPICITKATSHDGRTLGLHAIPSWTIAEGCRAFANQAQSIEPSLLRSHRILDRLTFWYLGSITPRPVGAGYLHLT